MKNQAAIDELLSNKHLRLNITYDCNLGCSYCVSHKQKGVHTDSIIDQIGIEAYLARLDILTAPFTDLQIDLMGEGDVLASKHFIPVFQWAMNKGYRINIQTNLHGIDLLERAIRPYGMKARLKVTVNMSYHLGEYLDIDPDHGLIFFYKICFDQLFVLGTKIGKMDLPLTPKCLSYLHLEDQLRYFQKRGVRIQLAALVGMYQGKEYPYTYTFTERQRLEALFKEWRNHAVKPQWTRDEIPFVKHQLYLEGEECYVRAHRVDIMANGEIRFCQSKPKWVWPTQIHEDPLPDPLFLPGPIPCPQQECGCQSLGAAYCLKPNGISLREYYELYYFDQDQPKIARLFHRSNQS